MVLRKHRVGGVCAPVVVEDDVLLVLAALDDLGRSSAELVLDLLEDGDDKRRHDGERPDRHLFFELLNNLGKDGDLLNGRADVLHELVVELNGGHDLPIYVLAILGKLLRIPWRNGSVLHLRVGGVILDIVHLSLLVTAKKAIWDLVEQVLDDASVVLSVVLQRALELVDLALGQFVGD